MGDEDTVVRIVRKRPREEKSEDKSSPTSKAPPPLQQILLPSASPAEPKHVVYQSLGTPPPLSRPKFEPPQRENVRVLAVGCFPFFREQENGPENAWSEQCRPVRSCRRVHS